MAVQFGIDKQVVWISIVRACTVLYHLALAWICDIVYNQLTAANDVCVMVDTVGAGVQRRVGVTAPKAFLRPRAYYAIRFHP